MLFSDEARGVGLEAILAQFLDLPGKIQTEVILIQYDVFVANLESVYRLGKSHTVTCQKYRTKIFPCYFNLKNIYYKECKNNRNNNINIKYKKYKL